MTLLKLCKCGRPIPLNESNCNSCNAIKDDRHKLYDKHKRNKESTSFYKSKEWKRLREEVYISQQGLCQRCLKQKKIVTGSYDKNGRFIRNIVDHIIPILIDWNKRLDKRNLQVLCQKCHNQKTAADKKLYG